MRSYLLAGNYRPLRRRHHRDGSARPARRAGVRHRPRLTPGHRCLLLRRRPPDHRRRGLADRLLARRRTGLQRRQGGRGHPRAARRAVPVRHTGRVPDARPVGRLAARPAAGRGDDDGRDPRARRRDRLDGLRRPRQCASTSPAPAARTPARSRTRPRRAARSGHDMHSCIERADMLAARVGKLVDLRRSRARRAQGGRGRLQLPAECRQHRHRGLPVGVRVAVQHDGGDAARGLHASRCRPAWTNCASASSTATRSATAPRPTCMRASRPTTTCGAKST